MSEQLTVADHIWNRACQEGGGPAPKNGDSALAALLLFHSLTMNGGVDHALECLTATEIHSAKQGYLFFGFEGIAELLDTESKHAGTRSDAAVEALDQEYWQHIPDDSALFNRFREHMQISPGDFSPYDATGA